MNGKLISALPFPHRKMFLFCRHLYVNIYLNHCMTIIYGALSHYDKGTKNGGSVFRLIGRSIEPLFLQHAAPTADALKLNQISAE